MIFASCCDLYQNDEILGSSNLETFSVNKKLQRSTSNPNSQYELYSDRYVRKYYQYSIDHNNLVLRANENTPTINFQKLKELMLSKDHSRMYEYE
jgi:hypothetical protein